MGFSPHAWGVSFVLHVTDKGTEAQQGPRACEGHTGPAKKKQDSHHGWSDSQSNARR